MPILNLIDYPDSQTEVSSSVCVIGAGIAGLAAAIRLARQNNDRSIVVVESGGQAFDGAIHDLNQVDDAFGTYQGALNGRYRGLGGTSSHWGGRLLPLAPSDSRARLHVGLDAWPLDLVGLDRYRADIEALFKVDADSFEETVLERLDRRGEMPRRDSDFTLRLPKWPTFRNCNVAHLLQSDLEAMKNLDVWLGSTVNGFEFDEATRRLRSITARSLGGKSLKITAGTFLFAAGTIETTRLLLLLDRAAEGKAFPRCEVLGRYFQDHLGAGVGIVRPADRSGINRLLGYHFIDRTRRSLHFETTAAAQEQDCTASAFAHVTMTIPEASPLNVLKKVFRGIQRGAPGLTKADLACLAADPLSLAKGAFWRYGRKQLYFPRNIELQLNIWIEQLPHWQNRISLSDQIDPFGTPRARIEWRPTEAEEKTFQACIARMQCYWERHSLATRAWIDWLPSVRERSAPVISYAVDLLHPSGSTRMGTSRETSVINARLQAHEVENLFVASASAFPSSGSANPTYTILQLAMYAADTISERLR